ncbi:MAG: hypothetical protein A2Y77_16140 [Planctomycetes bacterium RBG_13_62_9]|nr:MAG: hypothetical protein A2Y77_16140 [Planctomycetes bacterium RBG_13_62_9]
MIAVATAPTSDPMNTFFVIVSRMVRSFCPAAFLSPSDIRTMPNRNRPSPPMVPRIMSRIT